MPHENIISTRKKRWIKSSNSLAEPNISVLFNWYRHVPNVCVCVSSSLRLPSFYISFHPQSKFHAKCGKFEFYCFCLRQTYFYSALNSLVCKCVSTKKRLTQTKCENEHFHFFPFFTILCFMPDALHEARKRNMKKPRQWHFSFKFAQVSDIFMVTFWNWHRNGGTEMEWFNLAQKFNAKM